MEYEEASSSNGDSMWTQIPFRELTVCEVLAGGGVALVHRGIYRKNSVALKTLFDPRVDEALKQEFMDELLIMSKLQHPNIVGLIGACLEPPNLCMVMELCDYSLHHALHNTNAFYSAQQLTRLAGDIAAGMRYLHSLSPAVIHRDLKSANVLLDRKGTAKICDFGLVRTKITSAGTPSYMPPELLSGKPFSKAVDIYMFGVLLWEIFTREIPFQGFDAAEIRRKVIAGDRFHVPTIDCPEPCQLLMKRCWQENPTERPAFAEIHDILQEVSIPTESKALHNIWEDDALDALIRAK